MQRTRTRQFCYPSRSERAADARRYASSCVATMKVPQRNTRLAFLLLLLAVLACNHASCERNTTISIAENTNPPTFGLDGNGTLNFFWVSEVNASQPIPEEVRRLNGKDRIIWEIWPTNVPSTSIYDLPKIVYGKIPAGFTQKIPEQGGAQPLVEGKVYEAGGPSSGADMEVFRFTIKNGKAVELPLP
jgi:hypothetical protein